MAVKTLSKSFVCAAGWHRLMRPQRYKELGLSLEQSRSLAAHYVRSLRKEYGHVRPRELAKQIFDAIQRGDRRSGEQPSGVPGSSGSGGERETPADSGTNTPGQPGTSKPAARDKG